MAEKKEFLWTEVDETFKTMVRGGLTPEDFKAIRSNPQIISVLAFLCRRTGFEWIRLSIANFLDMIRWLTQNRGVMYVQILEGRNLALLLDSRPESFIRDSGFPYDAKRNLQQPIAYSEGARGTPWTSDLFLRLFPEDVNIWIVRRVVLPGQPEFVKVFSVTKTC